MRPEIDLLLGRRGGVATREELLAVVSPAQLDDEIRRRRLTRIFRRTYCRPWDADQGEVRERAALAGIGPPALLTGLSALRRWRLPINPALIEMAIPPTRSVRAQPGVLVRRVTLDPLPVRFDGLPTERGGIALVRAWTSPGVQDRRALVIDAVRRGVVSTRQLHDALDDATRLPGRHELATLGHQLADGCESDLEIWGHLHVFDAPGLDHGTRQLWVRAGGRRFRLDLGYEAERVAVELDGDTFHSSATSRDRDRRRDAALAGIGWLTLRFSSRRLRNDIEGCRRDTLATLAARRCSSTRPVHGVSAR